MRRIFSKTMNLEGFCPAVEIRTGVEKLETQAVAREGLAATKANLRRCD